MNRALLSSEKMDWRTPRVVVDLVNEFANGPIGLDPCDGTGSLTRATTRWRQGGLERSWAGHGLVYVNPPYGREIGAWAEKAAREALDASIVLLVPARTDTIWWHKWIVGGAICFWQGRLTFLGAPSCAPFPSAIVYFGQNLTRFRRIFSRVGWVVE